MDVRKGKVNEVIRQRKVQSGDENRKTEKTKRGKNGLGTSKEKDENKGGRRFPTVQLSDYIGGL